MKGRNCRADPSGVELRALVGDPRMLVRSLRRRRLEIADEKRMPRWHEKLFVLGPKALKKDEVMSQDFGTGFELLEERNLLAANVTASLVNGTLTITGTNASDDIELEGYGDGGFVRVSVNTGDLVVSGGNDFGSYGDFSGVTNIVINGGRGDDSISLDNIAVGGYGNDGPFGDVTINGGVGNDHISITAQGFGGNVIQTVVPNAELRANFEIGGYSEIYGTVNISGGRGDDNIEIHAGYGSYIELGNVVLNGNEGNDDIQVLADNFGNQSPSGDGGFITVDNLTLNGREGVDDLSVVASSFGAAVAVYGDLTINGGIGNDNLSTQTWYSSGLYVFGDLNMNGNAGDDSLSILSDGNDPNFNYGSVSLTGVRGPFFSNDFGATAVFGSLNMTGFTGQDDFLIDGTPVNVNPNTNSLAEPRDIPFIPTRIGVWTASIEGGNGDDNFEAEGVGVIGNVSIHGNMGNDTFCAENNYVGGEGGFQLNGGMGNDSAFAINNYVNGPTNVSNIENTLSYCPFDPIPT